MVQKESMQDWNVEATIINDLSPALGSSKPNTRLYLMAILLLLRIFQMKINEFIPIMNASQKEHELISDEYTQISIDSFDFT